MSRLSLALLVVLSSLFTAACTDTGVVASGATAPSGRSSDNGIAPPGSCEYGALRQSAASYFRESADPAFPMITDMERASQTSLELATAAAWPILRRVADLRLTSKAGTAAQGRDFLSALLACTNLNAEAGNLLQNAALVLDGGLFAVRSPGETGAAAAMLSVGSERTFAAPTWGVEPEVGSAWPASTHPTSSSPYLVFGYPIHAGLSDVTPATAINTNGIGSFDGFDLGSLPAAQDKSGLRVGICQLASAATTRDRLIHSDSIQLNENPVSLCSLKGPVAASYLSMRSVRSYLASLLLPASLYAQDGESALIGGHVSDWSPFTSAALSRANVSLALSKVADGTVDKPVQPFTVTVRLGTRGIPGVDVTLAIANNSGLPAGAEFTPGSKLTVTTMAGGVATFSNVAFHKPGGYTITATGNLGGLLTNTIISNPVFNIKKK